LERQHHLHIVLADIEGASRTELNALFQGLTAFARHQMLKPPITRDRRAYDPQVKSRRVTVTVGFGATLFTTLAGDDRYEIAGRRPACLKIMPASEGDDLVFKPRDHASDLIILLASDDVYVNEYLFGLLYYGNVHPAIHVKSVERGYARPDSREPSGFEDGISNPRDVPPNHRSPKIRYRESTSPMHHFVYIQPGDPEPDWCINGTYLGYRKIRRRLSLFFHLSKRGREEVFGVKTKTGTRLRSPPADSHAPKMNPRRKHPDFVGIHDSSRRMLRRPYFFDDGLDANGEEIRGLHHLSFARDLLAQYEWPVQMWQMNKDFPHPAAGIDALYELGGASNIGGGYYFMPAAPREEQHFGSALMGDTRTK
jgi:deferrochelatase/peroxidase EfeB